MPCHLAHNIEARSYIDHPRTSIQACFIRQLHLTQFKYLRQTELSKACGERSQRYNCIENCETDVAHPWNILDPQSSALHLGVAADEKCVRQKQRWEIVSAENDAHSVEVAQKERPPLRTRANWMSMMCRHLSE